MLKTKVTRTDVKRFEQCDESWLSERGVVRGIQERAEGVGSKMYGSIAGQLQSAATARGR